MINPFRALLKSTQALVKLPQPLAVALLATGLSTMTALAAAPASAVDLRIGIEDGASQVTVGSSTNADVLDATTRKPLGKIAAMNAFAATPSGGGISLDKWQAAAIEIVPNDPEKGYVYIGDRWYRGRVVVQPQGGGLVAVNFVNIDAYLYSVLGGEMNGSWPKEALKAQAVAARSYAMYRREGSIRAGKPYDLCNTARCQVYRGIQDEATGTQVAVNETRGEVMTLKGTGSVIEAVFHSSAGGCVDNVEDVWSDTNTYLRHSKDYDTSSPVFQWTKEFSLSELSSKLGVSSVQKIEPKSVSPQCKRFKQVAVIDSSGKAKSMDGDDFRLALGLRSTLIIDISLQSEGNKQAGDKVVITGRGFGHGLGLSQWGAYTAAKQGIDYRRILGNYYHNVELRNLPK